jgi:transglutaminase-like putative cysteine protease
MVAHVGEQLHVTRASRPRVAHPRSASFDRVVRCDATASIDICEALGGSCRDHSADPRTRGDRYGERVLVHVGCEFVQWAEMPTHAVLQVEPHTEGDFRVVDACWDEQTSASSRAYVDALGNVCRRLTLPAGRSVIRFDAHADVSPDRDGVDDGAAEVQPEAVPDTVLSYTLPSRFCPSDELGAVAWDLFGAIPGGWTRVQAISDWVHGELTYRYDRSASTATAVDVLVTRVGVCRDYAHLGIALCRALSIPARYAFGYLPEIDAPPSDGPMDFCAWMEVYLGGRWWTFDPRNGERRVGRVLIGRGRDALDVAMVSTFGTVELESMLVWADEVTG